MGPLDAAGAESLLPNGPGMPTVGTGAHRWAHVFESGLLLTRERRRARVRFSWWVTCT